MIRRHWLSHSVALSEWQTPVTRGPTGSTLQESNCHESKAPGHDRDDDNDDAIAEL